MSGPSMPPFSAGVRHGRRTILAFLCVGLLSACGGKDVPPANAATPGTPPGSGPGASSGNAPATAQGTAPAGTSSTGPSRGGARGGGSVVLSTADVYKVATGLIEAGTPISGNLRPIETVSIRSRLEGDIVALNVREGDAVRVGTVLAEFERSEQEAALRSAEADELAAKTEAQTAQWSLDQTRDLFNAGAVSERDMRAAEQAALTAAARLAATTARVRAAALVSRDTRVVSPVRGVIQKRNVENGERVSRGTELFTVVRSDVLELTAAVPARRAASLARGQVVRFTADGRTIEGIVARISPTIDLQSQSVTVFVEVPNRNGVLKGNTFATGQIIEKSFPDELLIPQAAVRQTAVNAGSQIFVWKVAGGSIARADVKLGVVDEARGIVQILEGLAVGDEIVIGNVGLLGVGMQVQVVGTETPRARP
jgi:membrane fusion protein (multidrug efflux system)